MNISETYDQAAALYEAGSYEQAIDLMNKVIEVDDTEYVAHFMKALSYIEMEDWENVIPSMEQVIELEPDLGDAYAKLGMAHSNLKNFDQAIPLLEKALEIGLEDAEPIGVYYNLGECYGNKLIASDEEDLTDVFNGATRALGKCLELNPGFIPAYLKLGSVCLSGEFFDRSVQYYGSVISMVAESHPEHPSVMESLLGVTAAYSGMEDYPQALQTLEQAISINEDVKEVAAQMTSFENLRTNCAEEFNALVS